MADDFKANARTTGSVAVGGETAGVIGKKNDVDWFAVELVAGRTYVIDVEGSDAGEGRLDAMLRGLYDAGGSRIAGTRNNDGGEGSNARLTFTATADGTHYIAARGQGGTTGTYAVRVTEMDTDATPAGATELGDLAGQDGARVQRDAVDGAADGADYYRFTLSEARTVKLSLRDQDADADLHLEDADGNVVASSTRAGTRSDRIDEALEAGTYYVRVVAQEAGENSYILRYRVEPPQVTAPPEPAQVEVVAPAQQQQQATPQNVSEPEGTDFSADTSTQGRVLVGGSATGTIETRGDVDWFAVEFEAGKIYRIDLKGSPTGDGTLGDSFLRGIRDAEGRYISYTANDDGGIRQNSQVIFAASADGTHYVAAGSKGDHTGTYTVSVVEVSDDYTADTGTTGTVLVGGSAVGEIEYKDDHDWFAVTLEKGKVYRIDLEGRWVDGGWNGENTLKFPFVRGIHDADGHLIDGTSGGRLFAPGADGTYYVAASSQNPATGEHTGTYTLSVTEVPDDTADGAADLGDITGQDGARVRRDTVDGAADGADYYRFTLSEASTVRLRLQDQDADADLYLEDGNGNVLDSSKRGGTRNERIDEALEAGTYYVRVVAREARDNAYALRYSVAQQSVSEPEGEDFSADTSTQGLVAVGGSATGRIETENDVDWFAVTLEKGKTYRIDLEGLWKTGDPDWLANPYLGGIYDPDGNFVAGTVNDNGGRYDDSLVIFTAPESGNYYVAAAATDDAGTGTPTGTYSVSVREYPVEEIADAVPQEPTGVQESVSEAKKEDFWDNASTPGRVAVGGSATGKVDYTDDCDWFAVDLEAGKTYRFELKATPTGNPPPGEMWEMYDADLNGIFDANGLIYPDTKNEDIRVGGDDARVFFKAPQTATYYVEAGPAFPDVVGSYELSVTEAPDDYTADTATTGRVSVGGSAAGEITLRGDRDWFAVELEAGKTYRVDLKGGHDGGTLWDPYLHGIHDEDGNYIAGTANNNADNSRNSRALFTAAEDGTYYVAAGAFDHGNPFYWSDSGTYTVSVEEVADAM